MVHRSTAASLTALIAGVLLVPGTAASAATETCQGHPATVVGTGPPAVGTPGDDVIVSGASTIIYAGAGDDLVCLTPTLAYLGITGIQVDAGPGDDTIDASVRGDEIVRAQLGVGRDHFTGGPANDVVSANGVDDEVDTDSGWDAVNLVVTGVSTSIRGRYDVGSGPTRERETLTVRGEDSDIAVELDGQIVVDGVTAADVTGFHNVDLHARQAAVRGNGDPNSLFAAGCQVRVAGRNGNDNISIDYFSDPHTPEPRCESKDRSAFVSGGRGHDRIGGSAGPDRLAGNAGNDRVTGRDGNDVLIGGAGRDVLFGVSGNDVLNGRVGNDKLVGGRGRDTADGGVGRDRCVAGVERRCER